MMDEPVVVAATRNRAKVSELAALLSGVAQVAALPSDISHEPEEPTGTVTRIAQTKATDWSAALAGTMLAGKVVVATDGGLTIPALGSAWEPAMTRRFAGTGASDRERADALLALTAHLDGAARTVGWQEVAAVARDGRLLATFAAESPPGLLARDYDPALLAAGGGFWVPALWICPEAGGRRLAELTAAERAARPDHWSRLGAALRACLTSPARRDAGDGARR